MVQMERQLAKPADRKGEFYRKELTVANTSTSVWQSVTNSATNETSVIGNLFVPKTPEAFTYDDDGNLTSDGHWTNRWDAENRLIEMEALSSVPDGAKKKLVFGYDWQGRRISKTVSNWVSSAWALSESKRFAYDGWNLMAVLSGTNLLQSFVWGTDLSGTMQGAGGVGGLVAFNDTTNVHFVAYDGNGNVTRLVKGSDGTTSGNYEFGAFGEPMRVTGTASKINPFRFSTKYTDDESDLLYYGYRYYNQSAGRWLSRDPIEELGGVNLYQFVGNDPMNAWDYLGLSTPECINLLAELARKAALLAEELAKYNPVADGKGGFPMKYGTGLTKPGGHFKEMMDLKRGIYGDLINYYKKCVCKDCGDPPPPQKIRRLS